MIGLGESYSCFKTFEYFFKCWSCLELTFLEINFNFLQSLIHRTQDQLLSKCDFDCHFTFLPPYYYTSLS